MTDKLSKNEIDKLLGLKRSSLNESETTQDDLNKRNILSFINVAPNLHIDMNDISKISWDNIKELIKKIDYSTVSLPNKNDHIQMISNDNSYITIENFIDILAQANKEIEKEGSTNITDIILKKSIKSNTSVIIVNRNE